MAEEIVSCPGCDKKFKIPEGAPGGTFQCTACSATVPYGKGAAKVAAQGKSAPPAKSTPPARAAAPAKPAPQKAAAPAPSRAAAQEPESPRSSSRDGRRGKKQKEAAPKQKSEKIPGGVLALMIGAGLLVVFMIVKVSMTSDPATVPPPSGDGPPATGPSQPTTGAGTQPATPPAATPPSSTKPAGGGGSSDDDDPLKPKASGIGGATAADSGGRSSWFKKPWDELFAGIEPVPGTTEEEAKKLAEDAVLFANMDGGRDSDRARDRMKKAGRKAVPYLLGILGKHATTGEKWGNDKEKWASFQVQQLLTDICKGSSPNKNWFARFAPRTEMPVADFERAARLWTSWWRAEGHALETFKPFEE